MFNPLAPLTFMPRLALRALDDLHQIAGATRRVPAQLDALLEHAEVATGLLVRIESMGRELLTLGERIDARAEALLILGERVDTRGEALIAAGEQMDLVAQSVLVQGQAIEAAAREVADRGGVLADALPALQRAVEIAEPLEGVVERVGRLADRLPGGRRISGPAPQSGADEEAMPRGTA